MTAAAAVAPMSAAELPVASLGTQPHAVVPCGTVVALVAVLVAGTPTRTYITNNQLSQAWTNVSFSRTHTLIECDLRATRSNLLDSSMPSNNILTNTCNY